LLKARITDRLIHGDPIPGDAGVHEPLGLARHHRLPIDGGSAVNLAFKAQFRVLFGARDA